MNRRNLLKTLSVATAAGLSGSLELGAFGQQTAVPKKAPTAPAAATAPTTTTPAPPPPVLTQDPNT